ncbi:MAG: hypothetical protein BWK76_13175 [Desulfobulbaceae bacterium A2]|nr:MAG: hypothetical protein BWK76_13175 [Desulfobulbaceae bacterium A2]
MIASKSGADAAFALVVFSAVVVAVVPSVVLLLVMIASELTEVVSSVTVVPSVVLLSAMIAFEFTEAVTLVVVVPSAVLQSAMIAFEFIEVVALVAVVPSVVLLSAMIAFEFSTADTLVGFDWRRVISPRLGSTGTLVKKLVLLVAVCVVREVVVLALACWRAESSCAKEVAALDTVLFVAVALPMPMGSISVPDLTILVKMGLAMRQFSGCAPFPAA